MHLQSNPSESSPKVPPTPPQNIYDLVKSTFRQKLEENQNAYADWRHARQQEMNDLAREADLLTDQRRRRGKKSKGA